MFKSIIAAALLAVAPVAQTKPVEAPPNLATLPTVAGVLTGVVSTAEKQPMHLIAVLAGLNTDGGCSEAIYQNADGKLTVGLLLGAKAGGWKVIEILRPL
jgi:hypothetical protein